MFSDSFIAVMCLLFHAKIYAEVGFVLILRKVIELLCLRAILVDGNLLHLLLGLL